MKNNVNTITRILFNFSNSIENRSPIFLVDKVFPKILHLKLIAWKSRWSNFENKGKRNDYIEWFRLEQVLDTIITNIGERALLYGRGLFSTLFLDNFKKHVQDNKDKQIMIANKKRHYTEDLFKLFYTLIFEKVAGSAESNYFWPAFPSEWKVTTNNLLNEKNHIAEISYNIFIHWAVNRIQSIQTFDIQLNDVSENLFPEVHPETWAMILIFVFSPYSPENRVKSVIERPWTFGFISRSFVFFGEKPEEIIQEQKALEEVQIKNTYELTYVLFKEVFTEENLEKYLKQANALKYSKASTENARKAKLLELLNGLLAYIKSKSR